ncbi:MAG: endonuclease/exonuclease/phosphatase family protein [Candidatus Wallbacteria bacterium]|nr:endonuclease/exonuclease/phosphatase family protein [Candidatus Wallbacteria bacterium]
MNTKTRMAWLLALVSLLGSAPLSARPLRVMTYNIRSGSGTQNTHLFGLKFFYGHGDKYLDRIADKAKALDVDVLCMEEVQGRSLRSEGYDQTGHIAERMGLKYHFWAEATSGGWIANRQGNCIISRFPIVETRRVVLNKASGNVEQRIAVVARIAYPDAGPQGTWVVCTHLYQRTDDGLRQKELQVLSEALKGCEGPMIVAGDFNADPGSRSIRGVQDGTLGRPLFDALADAGNGAKLTSDSLHPTRRIDYVFHDASFKTDSAFVPTKEPEDSDHLPVFVVLSVKVTAAAPAATASAPRVETGPDFTGLNQ